MEKVQLSEKEKMLSSHIYNANDFELSNERIAAKSLCFEYNNINPSDTEKQQKIIKRLFKKTGENISIMPSFWCDYGYNISLGDNVFINHDCVMLDCGEIIIGSNVFIAPQCGFYTVNHPFDVEKRNAGFEKASAIKIGNNVWLGGGVKIMPGVKIGDNSVIGAGSIVLEDIPENVLAAGNPCKIIRNLKEN